MNPILLTVWAVLAISFLALVIYRGQLTRYEDEQLFLNDNVGGTGKEQQTTLVRRVQQLQPLIRFVGGAAGLATVCAVGVYVYAAWQRIQ